jgi:hypothetical protein
MGISGISNIDFQFIFVTFYGTPVRALKDVDPGVYYSAVEAEQRI